MSGTLPESKFTVNQAAWFVVTSFGYLVFVILLEYFRRRSQHNWLWIGIATGVFLIAVGRFSHLRARHDQQSTKLMSETLEPNKIDPKT